MKTMELGVCSTFFLEQIHGGAAGVGCVWQRKFEVELFLSRAAWSSPKHALNVLRNSRSVKLKVISIPCAGSTEGRLLLAA
jgi:hypothetical protein